MMANGSESGNGNDRRNHDDCDHVALEVVVRRMTKPSFPTIKLEIELFRQNPLPNQYRDDNNRFVR